ncbi:MAG: NfeD family protein [Geobacteraceae bacterium]|jgi:inner membrane protein
MPYWLWLICGTALLIVEILAPHFVIIWFALAALITGVAAYWVGEVAAQLALFSLSSIILFSVGWGWLRKNMKMSARAKHANETVIGEAGTVVSANLGNPPGGKVRFQVPIHGDDVWEYISDEQLLQGDRCEVTELVGAKVKVKKV